MGKKLRSIAKTEYDKNRDEANKAAAKARVKIAEEQGKAALEGKHIDHKKPIAHGGDPKAKDNLKLISAKANLKKGCGKPDKVAKTKPSRLLKNPGFRGIARFIMCSRFVFSL